MKGRSYGIPLAAGIIFAFVAIVAGPRLLHRHSEMRPAPITSLEEPTVSSEPKPEVKQVTPAQPEHRSEASKAASISKPAMMKTRYWKAELPRPRWLILNLCAGKPRIQ